MSLPGARDAENYDLARPPLSCSMGDGGDLTSFSGRRVACIPQPLLSLEISSCDRAGVARQQDQERRDMMKSHRITGGGGIQLNVVETGNPRGRPIIFIHGASQCWLQWSRQMNSSLVEDHRLIALDMRGHGLSDKPHHGYDDSKQWVDDLNAVIRAFNFDHPVLCGWSYGPLVFLDYIR